MADHRKFKVSVRIVFEITDDNTGIVVVHKDDTIYSATDAPDNIHVQLALIHRDEHGPDCTCDSVDESARDASEAFDRALHDLRRNLKTTNE